MHDTNPPSKRNPLERKLHTVLEEIRMEAYESVQEAVAGYADAHPEADNENLRNYLQDYVDEEKRTLQSGHEHSPAYVNAVNDGLTAAIIDVTHEEDVTIQQWAHLH